MKFRSKLWSFLALCALVIAIVATGGCAKAATNTAFSSPTYGPGTLQAKLASYVVEMSLVEGGSLTSITLSKDAGTGLKVQNLKVKIGGSQFGSTRATISDTDTSLTFAASSPVDVAAGGSVVVDVYGDVLANSTSGTYGSFLDFTNWSLTGSMFGMPSKFPAVVQGQDVQIASAPTLTVATSSSIVPAQYAIMGTTGVVLAKARLTEGGTDAVVPTDLKWKDTIVASGGVSSFFNFSVKVGATTVAGPVAMNSAGEIIFQLTGAASSVAKFGSTEFVLVGDVATWSSGGAASGSVHVFSLDASGVTAHAASQPSLMANVVGAATSNPTTVYRTNLMVGSGTMGAVSGRARTGVDDIGVLGFSVNPAYQATVSSVRLRFTGGAVPANGAAFTVDLIDPNTNTAWGSSTQATASYDSVSGTWVAQFTPNYVLGAGTYRQVKIRVNSSGFANNANAADPFTLVMTDTSAVLWGDGTSSGIPLEWAAPNLALSYQ